MPKITPMLSLVLILTLINLAQPNCVWACDCDVAPVTDAINSSAAIFAGEVTSIVPSPQEIVSSSTAAVTFAVSRVWKGDMEPTITVVNARTGPSCGYEFQEGQEYLVYARSVDATLVPNQPTTVLQTGLCSGTQPLAEATDDLAVLGEGQVPTGSTPETQQPTVLPNTAGEIEAPAHDPRALAALGGVGVAAVIFVGYVRRTRLL